MVLGILFFSGIINLFFIAKPNAIDVKNTTQSIVLKSIFIGIIILFQIYLLVSLLRLRTIILTNENLIIKKPFLFQIETIPIENIRRISEKPTEINISTEEDVLNTINIYNGKQMELELYQGKTIKLNSIEIPEYDSLKKELIKQIRKNYGFLGHLEDFKEAKYLLTLFVLFIGIITFGLLYVQLKNGI